MSSIDQRGLSSSDLPAPSAPRPASRYPWAIVVPLVCALAGLALFVYPMYVIRPFRSQGAKELAAALALKQAGPWLSIGFASLAVGIIVWFWPSWRWARRSLGIVLALLAIGAVALVRFNVYEKMFHPIGTPAAESAQTAKIDSDDMVMAVNINGVSRAYPIRTMGYHHIANDVAAGEPIVATY
jgi:MFS family permease